MPQRIPMYGFKISRRLRRWLVGSVIGTVVAAVTGILVAGYIFEKYTDRLIGRFVKEVVYLKSDGLYRIDYDSIRLSFYNSELHFTDFKVLPDTGRFNELITSGEIKGNMINLSVPNISIKGVGLMYAYFTKEIRLNEVRVDSANLTIQLPTGPDTAQGGIKDLFSLIGDKFKLFYIKKLQLHEGTFAVYTGEEKIEAVNHIFVEARDFSIDEFTHLKNDRLFTVNDFSISVRDNVFRMEKEKIKVQVGEFSLNLKKKRLLVEDVRVHTLPGSTAGTGKFLLPRLRINDFDFDKLYYDREAHAESVVITGLVAEFTGNMPTAPVGEKKRNRVMPDIYAPMSSFLSAINIKRFLLDSSSFDITLDNTGVRSKFFSVELTDILIDSTARDNLKEQLYAQDMRLTATQLKVQPAGKSTITINTVRMKGREGLAELDEIAMKHYTKDSALVDVNIPSFRMVNLSFTDFLLRNIFSPDSLLISNARINYTPSGSPAGDFGTPGPLPDSMISAMFMNVDIKHYGISRALVQILQAGGRPAYSIKGINVLGSFNSSGTFLSSISHSRIKIDSLSSHKAGPRFRLSGLYLSLPDSSIRWNHAQYSHRGNRFTTDLLLVKGVHIVDYFKTGVFHCQSVSSDNATIEWEPAAGKKDEPHEQAIVNFQTDTFRLQNAKVVIKDSSGHIGRELGRLSCTFTDLKTDSSTKKQTIPFTFNQGRAEAQRIRWLLPDSMHSIQVASADWNSSEEKIRIHRFMLLPQLSSLTKSYFRVSIPLMIFKINITESAENFKENLHFKEIYISGADVIPAIKQKPATAASSSPFSFDSIFSNIPNLKVDKLTVECGKFKMRRDGKELTAGEISISGNRLKINKGKTPDAYRFVHSGSYSFNFRDIGFKTDSAEAKVGSLKFSSDQTRFEIHRLLYESQFTRRKLKSTGAERIELSDLHWGELLTGKGILTAGVNVYSPHVIIHTADVTAGNDDGPNLMQWKNLPDKLRPLLGHITIDRLKAENAEIKLVDEQGGIKTFRKLALQIDSLDLRRKYSADRFLYADNVTFYTKEPQLDFDDSLYAVTVSEAGFSSGRQLAWVKDFHLNPKPGRYEFGEKRGVENDRLDIRFDKLEMKAVDYERMLFEKLLHFTKVNVTGFEADIFRDKRLRDTSIYHAMPGEVLRKLKTPFRIDTLLITGPKITYAEHAEEGTEAGEIFIANPKFRITGITNDTALMNKRPMWINGKGSLMGKAGFETDMYFYLNDTTDVFYWKGDVNAMNIADFNPILVPVAFLHIKTGELEKMHFDIRADRNRAKGTMWMYYNDLTVGVVNKRTHTEGGVLTFLANSLVLQTNNPKYLILRKGRVDYKRREDKSIINYWIKALLTGVKSSVGLKKATRRREDDEDVFLPEYD